MGNGLCRSCQTIFGMGKGSSESKNYQQLLLITLTSTVRTDIRRRRNGFYEKNLEIEYSDSTYNIWEGASSFQCQSQLNSNPLKQSNSLTPAALTSPRQSMNPILNHSDCDKMLDQHELFIDGESTNEEKIAESDSRNIVLKNNLEGDGQRESQLSKGKKEVFNLKNLATKEKVVSSNQENQNILLIQQSVCKQSSPKNNHRQDKQIDKESSEKSQRSNTIYQQLSLHKHDIDCHGSNQSARQISQENLNTFDYDQIYQQALFSINHNANNYSNQSNSQNVLAINNSNNNKNNKN